MIQEQTMLVTLQISALNDPDAVRGNEGLRGNTATEAANILNKMKAMFSNK